MIIWSPKSQDANKFISQLILICFIGLQQTVLAHTVCGGGGGGGRQSNHSTCSLVQSLTARRMHGLSQYLEIGCPDTADRGFIDFRVSKGVVQSIYTTNKINPIYLHILLFLGQ